MTEDGSMRRLHILLPLLTLASSLIGSSRAQRAEEPPPGTFSLSVLVDGVAHSLPLTDADPPNLAVAMFCENHAMGSDDCSRLQGAAHASWLQHFNISSVRDQYEQYSYPPRDPASETPGIVRQGMPGMLSEINHWVFGGRLDLSAATTLAFRGLVVGCGTGDQALMLAHHLAESHVTDWNVVCLDLSSVSLRVARERFERHGLMGADAAEKNRGRVHIIRGSLLDEDLSMYGPFHYIAAVGVLHHLDVPGDGLRALRRWLHPAGGMGIMVYGLYGRRGVYEMQEAMRILKASAVARAAAAARARGDNSAVGAGVEGEEIAPPQLLRQLLANLPPTHPLHNLYVYREKVQRHWNDVELYDLFLHSTDQAYTVNTVAAFARDANLALVDLVPRAMYDPLSHVAGIRHMQNNVEGPAGLRRHIDSLGWLARRSFAELVANDINMHTFFLVLPPDKDSCPSGTADCRLLVGESGRDVAPTAAPGTTCNVTVLSAEVDVWLDVGPDAVPKILFGATAAPIVQALSKSKEQRRILPRVDRVLNHQPKPVLKNDVILPFGAIDVIRHFDGKRTVADIYELWVKELTDGRVQAPESATGDQWETFLNILRGSLEGLISIHMVAVTLPPASLDQIVSARTAKSPC